MAEMDLHVRKKKMATEDKIFYTINAIILIIFAVVTLYPVLNTLAYSFNEGNDAVRGGIYLWPRKWSLSNYAEIFKKQGMWQGLKVTFARTLLATTLSLFANALLSYILSRKNFLFKKSLSLFWLITMYAQAGLIPSLILYRYLHLTGTFWVYIIPGMVSAFNVMVMRTYMEGIPDSLEEAAQLEGAGYLKVFWSIITPLCKPVYATIFLFGAVWNWNSWFDAMLYNRFEPKYTTLQYELMKLLDNVGTDGNNGAAANGQVVNKVTPTTVRAAATIATMAPIIAIYPFLQRYFVTGLTIGGVKE